MSAGKLSLLKIGLYLCGLLFMFQAATAQNDLDEAWAQQSVEGHWANWVKCNWPPFEQDDHYGVTLVAVAMGMAPEAYTSVEPARTGIRRLRNYLANNEPEEVHHRAMMLWAAILSRARRPSSYFLFAASSYHA